MELAPIAFFAYNRPHHTLRALNNLSRCDLSAESNLHIFCDGSKTAKDWEHVRRVQDLVRSEKWCGSVNVVIREENIGLANSIISGVSSLIENYGRVIVLEDDLLVSPFFLRYMNDSLVLYEKNEQVMQISGYMFDIDLGSDIDAIFLPFTSSWGWATWKRAWKKFDPHMRAYNLLKSNKQLRDRFNLYGAYDYFRMLKMQKAGRIDSWAVRWYLSVFMDGGLILYPTKTLVKNIGWDASGIHCGTALGEDKVDEGFKVFAFPADLVVSHVYEKLRLYLKGRAGKILKIKNIYDVLTRGSVR
jgi:hypothetical protein